MSVTEVYRPDVAGTTRCIFAYVRVECGMKKIPGSGLSSMPIRSGTVALESLEVIANVFDVHFLQRRIR